MTTASQLRRKRQRQRMNVSAFKALIATPATGSVTIPAQGLFAIVTGSSHAAGTAATVAGTSARSIGVPAMAASQHHLIGKLEAGSVVTLAAWADLYLDTGLGKFRKIAKGT